MGGEGARKATYQRLEDRYSRESPSAEWSQGFDPSAGFYTRREIFGEQVHSFMHQDNSAASALNVQGAFWSSAEKEPDRLEINPPAWYQPSEVAPMGRHTHYPYEEEVKRGQMSSGISPYDTEENVYELPLETPSVQPKVQRWDPAGVDQGLNNFINRNRL